jgi:hypothetical protein
MALYDPKEFPTEAPAKVSPDFSVAEFLDWARRKPAGERYDYNDIANCAMCQFLRETGRALEPRVSSTWRERYVPNSRRPLPPKLDNALASLGGWTFGALVKRLEALSK